MFFEKLNQSLPLAGESEGGFNHLATITHLKNGANPADEYTFDAWGRRRDKDTWSYTLSGEPALFADRGFTSHEFLADFNLYNMNGRLYDPVVGRFLSPDPFIQDPSFSQSYNRYSYCLNNPLKFTDYSGEKLNWPKFDWFHAIPLIGQFDYMVQMVNDNTPQLRQKMVDAKIPDFNVNYNTMFGPGFSVGENPAYYPFYENKIADGQQGISNQIAGFSGMGANTGSPRFGNGDINYTSYEELQIVLSDIYHNRIDGNANITDLIQIKNSSNKGAMVGSFQDGYIGKAHLSIYLDKTAVPTYLKYYAEGGSNLRKQIFSFKESNLIESNFPSRNIYGKVVAEPFAIRIQGYFGERSSVIGIIRFSDWQAFYNFNRNIY
jgi:RHS repeat-associated protein